MESSPSSSKRQPEKSPDPVKDPNLTEGLRHSCLICVKKLTYHRRKPICEVVCEAVEAANQRLPLNCTISLHGTAVVCGAATGT
nr:unnamed protein product [Spirometra erinaceieuropaei]